jgi:peptidoglycan-associated lipoprotein
MQYRTFLILLITVVLAACSTTSGKGKREDASIEDRGSTSTESTATTYGTGRESTYGISELDDPQSPLSKRIIYFEYDSSEIQAQYRSVIEAHALYVAANPGVNLSLEGHADERGSREYNLALGERRAQTVKNQMTVLGAAPAKIRTISYGEERPVDEGHDEYSWSQNRRVELIY